MKRDSSIGERLKGSVKLTNNTLQRNDHKGCELSSRPDGGDILWLRRGSSLSFPSHLFCPRRNQRYKPRSRWGYKKKSAACAPKKFNNHLAFDPIIRGSVLPIPIPPFYLWHPVPEYQTRLYRLAGIFLLRSWPIRPYYFQ